MNIKNDYKKAEKVIKKHSKSFYAAFSTISNLDQRNAIYGIYAFCRYADDIVDESKDITKLEELKNQLDLFIQNKETPNYIFRLLKDISCKYYDENFNYEPYYDMIEGQYFDLDFKEIKDLNQLIWYSTKVASSVGYMLMDILAPNIRDDRKGFVAYHLGIGMQITNILRDIGEDLKRNRVYLPKELMDKYHVTMDDLIHRNINDNFINLFEALAKVAFEHYEKALLSIDVYPKETRIPLKLSLYIYREIINECRNNQYQVFQKRNKVSKKRKLEIIREVLERE